MIKVFTKTFLVIFFLLISFIGYLSLVGFETKRFNNQIKQNLKKIDSKIDIKLNEVKIVLDLFNLNINAKTLGPIISYDNQSIDIELIKSDLSLFNLLNEEFSLSNLVISTKSVKLRDAVAFIRAINKKNKTKILILENFVKKGFLIADINLNFDDQGKVKNDFKITGLVKEGSINLLNKKKINKIDFIFETENKNININDLKFTYENVNFTSKKIRFLNKNNFIKIVGEIKNDEVNLSNEIIKNFLIPYAKINIQNLKFSSKNEFTLNINNKFKISDYEIKSLLNIKELSIQNNFNIKNIFPYLEPNIKIKNHSTEIVFKKDYFLINGKGNVLAQKKLDQINYEIQKIKDQHLFNLEYNFVKNPIVFDFLNYKTDEDLNTELSINGKYVKDKSINFKKIELESGSDLLILKNLGLNKNFRVSDIRHAKFNFKDRDNKKNIFEINKVKDDYLISGKVFNASQLIDDLIFEDNKKNQIFDRDFSISVDLEEVYLENNYIVYDLKGILNLKDNRLINANISSSFNDNQKVNFTIISKDEQKVTTLFSDQAKPFVKKFDFIKGFEEGSLDFYSVESNNISNSKLKIYDFKLKELPVLTKILTLASLQGIADLLSGEGIRFSEFEMNFKNKDTLMTIDEIYAIGPAISILMEGYIEKKNLVSLRGTLVPATTINKAIGSIPLIGDILVGKKTGEGVFGVSFKIKGPPKKLETSVNPIKTLTPRFITRTLEKIKKN